MPTPAENGNGGPAAKTGLWAGGARRLRRQTGCRQGEQCCFAGTGLPVVRRLLLTPSASHPLPGTVKVKRGMAQMLKVGCGTGGGVPAAPRQWGFQRLLPAGIAGGLLVLRPVVLLTSAGPRCASCHLLRNTGWRHHGCCQRRAGAHRRGGAGMGTRGSWQLQQHRNAQRPVGLSLTLRLCIWPWRRGVRPVGFAGGWRVCCDGP